MFLQRIETARTKKDGSLSLRPSITYQFKCDGCEKVYEKRPGNVSVSKTGLHFCSNGCKFTSHRHGGELRKLAEATSLDRYGNAIPMRSIGVTQTRVKTLQERYGEHVTAALHIPGAKERRQRTHLERYGVEHTFQVEAFKQKRNATWRQNLPKNFISKTELKLKALLEKRFGADDVCHQKWVNGHPIDFYVKSADTYVQFDGVYWHGLNRPLDMLSISPSPRDRSIYTRWMIDREQDAWFAEKNLRLVRITDSQLAKDGEACLDVISSRWAET